MMPSLMGHVTSCRTRPLASFNRHRIRRILLTRPKDMGLATVIGSTPPMTKVGRPLYSERILQGTITLGSLLCTNTYSKRNWIRVLHWGSYITSAPPLCLHPSHQRQQHNYLILRSWHLPSAIRTQSRLWIRHLHPIGDIGRFVKLKRNFSQCLRTEILTKVTLQVKSSSSFATSPSSPDA